MTRSKWTCSQPHTLSWWNHAHLPDGVSLLYSNLESDRYAVVLSCVDGHIFRSIHYNMQSHEKYRLTLRSWTDCTPSSRVQSSQNHQNSAGTVSKTVSCRIVLWFSNFYFKRTLCALIVHLFVHVGVWCCWCGGVNVSTKMRALVANEKVLSFCLI